MTEPRQYDGGAAGSHSSPVQHPGQSLTPPDSAEPAESTGHTASEAVAGPFTLRETVIGVSVLVMFVGTILPFVEGVNLWMTFSLFFLGIGILLPVAALALLVARRLGSKNLRVGSLSVDQFASVAAAFAASFFFLQTVTTFGIGQFIALVGSVGFLAATVGGPHLGIFASDFTGRPSATAHLLAREALPARPRPPKPVPAEQVSRWQTPADRAAGSGGSANGYPAGPSSTGYSAGYAVAGFAAGQTLKAPDPEPAETPAAEDKSIPTEASPEPAPTMAQPRIGDAEPRLAEGDRTAREAQEGLRTESISATRDADEDEPVVEAFWFAVGTPRSVVDEQTGAPLFVLQPGDWEVGIEDRGHEFLVQDKRTGRVGVMRDLRNIERAPQEG